jgi:hypothetical protein
MAHDLLVEPTLEQMKADYAAHCSVFSIEGITFYYHLGDCGCYNCTKTRAFYASPNAGRTVTYHKWDSDKHWYMKLGYLDSKERGAAKLLRMMARECAQDCGGAWL